MLFVFILYCAVGMKDDAKARKAIRKAKIKKAAELNFNTVEEYEDFLKQEEERQKEEKEQKKPKNKVKKAKKNNQKDVVDNEVDEMPKQSVFGNDMNTIAQEINMDDIQQLIADQQKTPKQVNIDVPNEEMGEQLRNIAKAAVAESINQKDAVVKENISDDFDNTVVISKDDFVKEYQKQEVTQKTNEEENIPEQSDEDMKVSEQSSDGKSETQPETTEVKEVPNEEPKDQKNKKTGFFGRKKSQESEVKMDETSVDTGNGEKIGLEQLQELMKHATVYEGSEEIKLKEPEEKKIPEATPYVQSIPRILNTKEAIAVSKEAPKVTTFYPDGKVVRDNKLVNKKSFYREEHDLDKTENIIDDSVKMQEESAKESSAVDSKTDTGVVMNDNTEETSSAGINKAEDSQPDAKIDVKKQAVDLNQEISTEGEDLPKTVIEDKNVNKEENISVKDVSGDVEVDTSEKTVKDNLADIKEKEKDNVNLSETVVNSDEKTISDIEAESEIDKQNLIEQQSASKEENSEEVSVKDAGQGNKVTRAFEKVKGKVTEKAGKIGVKAVKNQVKTTADLENIEEAVSIGIIGGAAGVATNKVASKNTEDAVNGIVKGAATVSEALQKDEKKSEKIKEQELSNDILMPEKPKAFGYKVAWLAVPNMGSAEVLKALGLRDIAPANWTSGLTEAYKSSDTLFVTPNLNGWTLVVGRALWKKIDINQPIEKNGWLQKLADSFREVFYFTTMSDLGNNGWFYIKNGLLVRAYGYSGELGEVMWNFGQQSQEEHKLIQGFSMGKTKVVPTEKDVLTLAAAWSVDTSFTKYKARPDIGFVGNI